MHLLSLAVIGSASTAIERGNFWWTFPDTDCFAGDELGQCGTPGNATVQECKAACYANPNCGGFNIPNGHLKKVGCMDSMVPCGDDCPVNSKKPLNLFALSLYPPRREYWWELNGWDCNPDHELGSCKVPGLSVRGQQEHCKEVCQDNIFCEGFNLPNGHLKAAGCKDDLVYKPEWSNGTMRLYYQRGHPQVRDDSLSYLKKLEKSDCNPGQELGNCSQYLPPPYTVSECETACKANPLCGGFNLPNGHLKTVDCYQEFNTSHSQDLYYFARPPPPPPAPSAMCHKVIAEDCPAAKYTSRVACLDCADAHQAALSKVCTDSEVVAYCNAQ